MCIYIYSTIHTLLIEINHCHTPIITQIYDVDHEGITYEQAKRWDSATYILHYTHSKCVYIKRLKIKEIITWIQHYSLLLTCWPFTKSKTVADPSLELVFDCDATLDWFAEGGLRSSENAVVAVRLRTVTSRMLGFFSSFPLESFHWWYF